MKKLLCPVLGVLLFTFAGCGNQNYLPEDAVITSPQNGTWQNEDSDPTVWRCGADGSLCTDDTISDSQEKALSDNDNNQDELDDTTGSGNKGSNTGYNNTGDTSADQTANKDTTECQALASCKAGGLECGAYTDSCGTKFDCGSCAIGYACQDNKCYSPCDPNPCTGPDNVCTPSGDTYYCSCEPGYELDSNGNCQKLSTVSIRLMAANITSGNKQSYQAPGIRMFLAFQPDVVMIQEFNYYENLETEYKFDDLDSFVHGVFGPQYTYHRGTERIPNGIISRYPILEAGTWDDSQVADRSFEYARIDIPGDVDLWAISVHLLTTTGKQPTQAKEIINYINSKIPKGDYIAIGGDFNTKTRGAAALTQLNKVVVTQTSAGYPCDQNGDVSTNANRNKPYDGVYVSSALHEKEVPITIKGHSYEYTHGMVFDSRVFTPLSAVSPVQKADSSASNMQHMPVIRDFKLW